MIKSAVLLFALFLTAFGRQFQHNIALRAPLLGNPENPELVEGSYIIKYKDEVSSADFESNLLAYNHIEMEHTYRHALKGFSARLSATQVEELRSNPLIDYLEYDQMMYAQDCNTQQQQATWGISRVSTGADWAGVDLYNYDSNNQGEGVEAYIIDTGIYLSNQDFEGRATFGFKASSSWSDTDANGHGTHVASTTGGVKYGVAKKASLIAVKVLGDNGSGTNAGVIAGVDYVAGRHSSSKKSTGNMSLGGGASSALDAAVNGAVSAGVVMVVAAGNDNRDACSYSPARATSAITVMSTTSSDVRSSFSNYGTCCDLFAPGSAITAAWIGSTTATSTISGTSMASPHVCGVSALLLNEGVPASQMKSTIDSYATNGVVNMQCGASSACLASPNKMAFSCN